MPRARHLLCRRSARGRAITPSVGLSGRGHVVSASGAVTVEICPSKARAGRCRRRPRRRRVACDTACVTFAILVRRRPNVASCARLLPSILLVLAALPSQQSVAQFESPQTQAICRSADGTRLYVVNTPDHRMACFSLTDPARPVLLREIPVALEPVAVACASASELWVVGHLSDAVAVVDVETGVGGCCCRSATSRVTCEQCPRLDCQQCLIGVCTDLCSRRPGRIADGAWRCVTGQPD